MKVAIASGKGGTGKTFLATNLFAWAQRTGLRVAMADCDAEVPNDSLFLNGEERTRKTVRALCPEIRTDLCTKCGLCARNCAFHAITCIPKMGYIRLMADLCHGCGACLAECPEGAVCAGWKTVGCVTCYDCGGGAFLYEARLDEGEHSPVGVIREALRCAGEAEADLVILDAPPGCSCPFVTTVAEADLVILITEPTPFGLSDLRHTVEVLRRMRKPFAVVINRADLGDDALRCWLRREGIGILAEIPYSERIAALYSQGMPVVGEIPGADALFGELLHKIMNHEDSGH